MLRGGRAQQRTIIGDIMGQGLVKANTTMQAFGTSDEVKALDKRLQLMLPGADKLTPGQRLALAQAAIAHGLDPFNGEIWMIPGRGLMVGVKGLRKKAHEQVRGNYWIDFRFIDSESEREQLRIPKGALAYEARLFDTENINTYVGAVEKLTGAKIPWEAVERMVGSKPYTSGIGVLAPGEPTKMQPMQCAMKRAEADAIKRRFDVPFGMETADDDQLPDVVPGEFVVVENEPANATPETSAQGDYRPDPAVIEKEHAERLAKRKAEAQSLFQDA
jgi:hypothetical protein